MSTRVWLCYLQRQTQATLLTTEMLVLSSRRLRSTLIIVWLGAVLIQAKKPFQRMQQTTGQTESTKGELVWFRADKAPE